MTGTQAKTPRGQPRKCGIWAQFFEEETVCVDRKSIYRYEDQLQPPEEMKRLLCFYSNAVWPPPFLVWLFVVAYGLVTGGLRLIERPLHGSGQTVTDTPEIRDIRVAIIGGAAAIYALFRLLRFHPICNQAYADWLQSTPWTAARPLPLGPIHPVLQDIFVIGGLSAIAVWHAHVDASFDVYIWEIVERLPGETLR